MSGIDTKALLRAPMRAIYKKHRRWVRRLIGLGLLVHYGWRLIRRINEQEDK